jgi:hypothetical protein
MKSSVFAFLFLFSSLLSVFGSPAQAADLCRAKALLAAEDYYGNAPHQTSVKMLSAERSYLVSVGRGNPEDGEHFYSVVFAQGCQSKPVITEVGQ